MSPEPLSPLPDDLFAPYFPFDYDSDAHNEALPPNSLTLTPQSPLTTTTSAQEDPHGFTFDVVSYNAVDESDFELDGKLGVLPINTFYIFVPWRERVSDLTTRRFACQGCGRTAFAGRGEIGVCFNCDAMLYCVYCTAILELDDKEDASSHRYTSLSTLHQYDHVRKDCYRKPCHYCRYNGAFRCGPNSPFSAFSAPLP